MTPDPTEPLLLPHVHRSLHAAARRRTESTATHRPTRRVPRRTIGLLTVAAALAGGTALAATTPWSPTVGDERRGHPTLATTEVPAAQRDALAVLRRPQEDRDRTPAVAELLKLLIADLTGGVHLPSVRALDVRPDGTTVLFAAERDGKNQPGFPPEERREVVCLLYGTDIAIIRGVRTRIPGPSAGTTCGTTTDLRRGRIFMGAQWDGRLELNGLVPDGVAGVAVTLRTGRTVEASVENNTFHIDTAVPDGSYEDAPIRWLDADGAPVPKR